MDSKINAGGLFLIMRDGHRFGRFDMMSRGSPQVPQTRLFAGVTRSG